MQSHSNVWILSWRAPRCGFWPLLVSRREHSARAWLVIWLLTLHLQPGDKATREGSAAVWLTEH